MRMRVDESRQDGGVAQIVIGGARAVGLDGGDAVAGDGDDAALQRRSINGEDPAGGQRPFGWRHAQYSIGLAVSRSHNVLRARNSKQGRETASRAAYSVINLTRIRCPIRSGAGLESIWTMHSSVRTLTAC